MFQSSDLMLVDTREIKSKNGNRFKLYVFINLSNGDRLKLLGIADTLDIPKRTMVNIKVDFKTKIKEGREALDGFLLDITTISEDV